MTIENANMASLTMEIEISASADKVWSALTTDIGKWWPADFYAGGSDGARTFVLEASPGGRMYEDWKNGGVLWGTVVGVNPGKQLQITGSVFPSFGGPTQWYGTWDLKENTTNSTILTFSEVGMGRVSDKGTEEKVKGWGYLWGCMHAFIDGRAAPAWE